MTLPIILRTDAELNMGASVIDRIKEFGHLVTSENDDVQTLKAHVRDAELVFTCYAPISDEVIAAGTRLRGIVKYGVGVDSIDLEAATEHGIPVVHCPDYGTETVADHAFALLIGVARKIAKIDRSMRSHGWLWPSTEYCGVDLAGKTIGLIGFGRIGRAMARRANGFRMRQFVYDPYVATSSANYEASRPEFRSLQDVIENSDFLCLHCVLTPETNRIIGTNEFLRMKKSAILINVSRGNLVDEDALVEALNNQRIAGAGLDVFVTEPIATTHPLMNLDNVILTPHFAFYSREAYERLECECCDAMCDLMNGKLPSNIKNVEFPERVWYDKHHRTP